jgi:hypothetical protein
MTLYEMLANTLYYQQVWIYETNAYDQNMPLFKGVVEDARQDTENVWHWLMAKVEHYQCNTGILVIKVVDERYEERLEDHYFYSEKWGLERSERPWLHSIEIDNDLKKEMES